MHLTSSELQALDRARYDLAALQVEVQLLRLQLIYKANFNPNQPRVPRGHPDGGRWSRVGGSVEDSEASRRVGAAEDTRPAEPIDRAGTETTTLPGNRQLVRDRSGTEPWEVYVDTLRPNGSVAERVVINRDGSAIRSEFSTTPELTGWDESHTVIGAGGEMATFQNLGKTQTILDATRRSHPGRVVDEQRAGNRVPAARPWIRRALLTDLGWAVRLSSAWGSRCSPGSRALRNRIRRPSSP